VTGYVDDLGFPLGERDRREFGVRWGDGPPLAVADEEVALRLRDLAQQRTGEVAVVVSRVVRADEWQEW
jgi:hypothetical protein